MRRGAVVALALLLGGCATRPASVENRPLYTKAGLSVLSTEQLAAQFLPPAEAATVEKHWIEDAVYLARDRSWDIRFRARPRPIGPDICERAGSSITFFPTKRSAGDERPEMPARADKVYRYSDYALAPGCRDLPGLRFARVLGVGDNAIPDEEGITILRNLAAAQAAAAGPAALPFRLSCVAYSLESHPCGVDLRAVLAGLPLHHAFTVERHPFPNNCDRSSRDEGDAVEIGQPDDREVWDVRLRRFGTDQAEVVLIRQFSRTHVQC
jgi:hypothetical protein